MQKNETLAVSAICFDLDGTLLDTVPLIVASHQAALADYPELAGDVPFLVSTIGLPLEFVYNETRFGEQAAPLMHRFIEHNVQNTRTSIGIFRGIIPMLAALKKKDIPLGLVTAKRRSHAILAMELFNLVPYFDTVLGREDSKKHKPDPAPLIEALRRMNISDDKHLLYVGDSIHDLMAANNLGCYAAAVAWSQTPKDELMAQQPALWIEHALELPSLVTPVV